VLQASRKPRDEYERVGRSMRLAIARAHETAEGRELTRLARVFLAALSFTASYSKLSDTVFLAQLCDAAGIRGDVDLKHTADALKTLAERGVLLYEPSTTPGRPSWIALPDAGLGDRGRQQPLVNALSGSPSNVSRTFSEGGPLRPPERHLSGPPSLVVVDNCVRCGGRFEISDMESAFCPECA
jgi:hypothetical protein